MRQCQDGTIPKGSYLIIENLDRLSREAPQEAQYWMLTIQRAGVSIQAANEGVDYALNSKDGGVELMKALIGQQVGFENPQKMSNRTLSEAHEWHQSNVRANRIPSCLFLGPGSTSAIPKPLAQTITLEESDSRSALNQAHILHAAKWAMDFKSSPKVIHTNLGDGVVIISNIEGATLLNKEKLVRRLSNGADERQSHESP